jgi:hypothetical protein
MDVPPFPVPAPAPAASSATPCWLVPRQSYVSNALKESVGIAFQHATSGRFHEEDLHDGLPIGASVTSSMNAYPALVGPKACFVTELGNQLGGYLKVRNADLRKHGIGYMVTWTEIIQPVPQHLSQEIQSAKVQIDNFLELWGARFEPKTYYIKEKPVKGMQSVPIPEAFRDWVEDILGQEPLVSKLPPRLVSSHGIERSLDKRRHDADEQSQHGRGSKRARGDKYGYEVDNNSVGGGNGFGG